MSRFAREQLDPRGPQKPEYPSLRIVNGDAKSSCLT